MDENTLENLIRSLESIYYVQKHFHAYQETCFPQRPPEFFALELAGEAGEVANNEKKKWKGLTSEHARFEDEAADVFIALINYANSRKIDLSQALAKKLKKIKAIRLERLAANEQY